MLGVRRSPEYAYISSMRCPNGSFDSLMRFFGLDYGRLHTLSLLGPF
jgi:hypothetical protein